MKNQFLAFLGGAIAGAAVALLLAPKSGEELREDIKDYVDLEIKKGKKLIDKGRQKVAEASRRMADSACEKLEEVADQVDEVSQRVGHKTSDAIRKAEKVFNQG